ncbi:MAG: hypothetical protein NC246_03840 [Muribaculaceae bacterium]|nr:hypothetical protein [Muribaculaceae bacterium]
MGIIAFLAFPILLNAAITYKWYYKIPIQSDMTAKEWFGFWGSYIGSMVAILLGWVTYRQAELSNKQDQQAQMQQEQIARLTEIVNRYQLKPRIAIRSVSIEVFSKPLKEYQVNWYIEELYFTYFGHKKTMEGKRYIVLTCDIINEGMVPVTKYDVDRIEWEIADKKFDIFLKDYRDISITDKMVIIIDEHTDCSDSIEDLFDMATMHVKYNNYKRINFDKSILTLGVRFYNSIDGRDSDGVGYSCCKVRCMINSARMDRGSNKVKAVPYIEWGE